VLRWFTDVKVEESRDTFYKAYKDSRMTVRAILESRQTGHYAPTTPVRIRGDPDGVKGERYIRTMQGVAGVKARMDDSNWVLQGSITSEKAKYKDGLFDVSATLLDGTRRLKIGDSPNQMYRASGDATWVFMPVSPEEDMCIFFMLNRLAKSPLTDSRGFKQFVQYMKSRLTRIKFAFEGDAGATFMDFSPRGELHPKFKYGFGKMMPGDATDEEIKQRKLAAVEYKKVLLGRNRNEIILAYRQHGTRAQGSIFPLYAKGVFDFGVEPSQKPHKGFAVVNEQMVAVGDIITLAGEKQPGTAESLGGQMTYPKCNVG
jgi:hypothetical protein